MSITLYTLSNANPLRGPKCPLVSLGQSVTSPVAVTTILRLPPTAACSATNKDWVSLTKSAPSRKGIDTEFPTSAGRFVVSQSHTNRLSVAVNEQVSTVTPSVMPLFFSPTLSDTAEFRAKTCSSPVEAFASFSFKNFSSVFCSVSVTSTLFPLPVVTTSMTVCPMHTFLSSTVTVALRDPPVPPKPPPFRCSQRNTPCVSRSINSPVSKSTGIVLETPSKLDFTCAGMSSSPSSVCRKVTACPG
mmetsp:Transcript_3985/g.13290  ORF Transcript_3985/g.13290 Transcript_3985/m.13290 type:complete len:245 (+) Transcript_3985:40-774(+)